MSGSTNKTKGLAENTKKADLFDAYAVWCEEEGGQWLSKSELTARMKRLGFKEGRTGAGRYWRDIKLDLDAPIDMGLYTGV